MAAAPTIYDYTPAQARLVQLYDYYRTCLMNAKYYARRIEILKWVNLGADILTAIVASSAFVGLAIWKSDVGKNLFSVLLGSSAVISVLRPVLRLSEKIDRCAKLHYGYLELYYRIDLLIAEIRTAQDVNEDHLKKMSELSERFRSLELEGDAYQSPKMLLKYQDEIERVLPADRLWLPSK